MVYDAGRAMRGVREKTAVAGRVLESAVAAVGFALSVGAVGLMGYLALAGPKTPPNILVEAERITPAGPGYRVAIVARNRGDRTGATVKVEGVLTHGSETLETRETTFDYVPGRSERRGGLYFVNDPNRYALSLRAVGEIDP